jgi:hypothetical protein
MEEYQARHAKMFMKSICCDLLNGNRLAKIVITPEGQVTEGPSGLSGRYEREANRDNRHRIAGSGNHCSDPSETPPLYNGAAHARSRTQNAGCGQRFWIRDRWRVPTRY